MGRGKSKKGVEKPYGTEFSEIFTSGNIMFIRSNGNNSTNPRVTHTRGRVYVTVNKENTLKSIIYFDNDNMRKKQIDLDHSHNEFMDLHTHVYGKIEMQKKGSKSAEPGLGRGSKNA